MVGVQGERLAKAAFRFHGPPGLLLHQADVQDELGALNDAAVAAELVARLDLKGRARKAAEGLLAVRAVQKPKTVKAAARAMDRLAAAPLFWRG